MSRSVIRQEVTAEFQAASNLVLTKYAAEDIQHMGQAELQRIKSLLGHGEEWTRWSTPRDWFPSASPIQWNLSIEEKIVNNVTKLLKRSCESVGLFQTLVAQAVLVCNRYLVLCRIGPVSLKNGRESLDPSVVSGLAYQSVTFIAAISVAKAMPFNGEGPIGIDESDRMHTGHLSFASVSREDVDSLPLSATSKTNIYVELKRMHAAASRGLWADAPPIGVNPQKATRVSGDAETPLPVAQSDPHLPLPDDFVCELGNRSYWIIEHLGPNILRILSVFQDLWQDAYDSKMDVRVLSRRCAAYLKDEIWTDAKGQLIEALPFELQLNKRGAHSKEAPKAKNLRPLENLETKLGPLSTDQRAEAWPPRGATQVFGLARVLQGAHLFVTGLSTGCRNGEILTMERSAIRQARDGTTFANGRTYKLVRRHDGELRDWPLPEFAERAFEQQVKLISLTERLSPLSALRPLSNPREIPDGRNLWYSSGNRTVQANSAMLGQLLKHYSRALGLETEPGGQAMRAHRLRKTLARLVALAIVQAPKLLQDVFGHKHIEMTIYYILADKALSAEIDEIVRELRVIRCADDLEKFVAADEARLSEQRSISGDKAIAHAEADTTNDGYGGSASSSIRRAVTEHGRALHQRSQDWGAADIRDLAEVLTFGGTTWNLVRPGVMCTKSLNQFGPCNKKRGHPDPASCQTSCDYRLEQAWLREEVDSCISQALQHWQFEVEKQQELVADFWAGQVRMHLGRFKDLELKWRLDARVQQICQSEGLCET